MRAEIETRFVKNCKTHTFSEITHTKQYDIFA